MREQATGVVMSMSMPRRLFGSSASAMSLLQHTRYEQADAVANIITVKTGEYTAKTFVNRNTGTRQNVNMMS